MFMIRMMALCILVLIMVVKFVWTEFGAIWVIAGAAVGLVLFVGPELHLRMGLGGKRHLDEGERYLELGDLRSAESEFTDAIQQAKSPGDRAFVFMRLSEPQRRQRKFEAAEESVRSAMELLRAAKKADGAQYAACVEQLAAIARDKGAFPEALTLFRESLEMAERLPKADPREIAKRYLDLGLSQYQSGDLLGSVEILAKAQKSCEAAFGPTSAEAGSALATLGAVYQRLGEYAKAKPLLQRGMDIQKETRGHNDPHVAQTLYHLAIACQHTGERDVATSHLEHLLELRERHLERNPTETGEVMCRLAEVYIETASLAKAEDLVRRAIFYFESKQDEHLAGALDLLASIYDRSGRYADALPLYERARMIWGEGPEAGQVARKQAAVLRFLRRNAEADALLQSSPELQSRCEA